MPVVTHGWKRTVVEQGSVGFAFVASADHVIISKPLYISMIAGLSMIPIQKYSWFFCSPRTLGPPYMTRTRFPSANIIHEFVQSCTFPIEHLGPKERHASLSDIKTSFPP